MDTCDAIRKTFMELYAGKRMDCITVKELCASVPVARTTFYAHYRNVDDVLQEVENHLLGGLTEVAERVSHGDMPHMDFSAFLEETFAFIKDNWDDFRALLVVQPDARFITRWRNAVKANFARRYPAARIHDNWELIAEMAASAAIGAYTYWMEHPEEASIENAKQLAERALSAVMAAL